VKGLRIVFPAEGHDRVRGDGDRMTPRGHAELQIIEESGLEDTKHLLEDHRTTWGHTLAGVETGGVSAGLTRRQVSTVETNMKSAATRNSD
jgi:hypothetical protein